MMVIQILYSTRLSHFFICLEYILHFMLCISLSGHRSQNVTATVIPGLHDILLKTLHLELIFASLHPKGLEWCIGDFNHYLNWIQYWIVFPLTAIVSLSHPFENGDTGTSTIIAFNLKLHRKAWIKFDVPSSCGSVCHCNSMKWRRFLHLQKWMHNQNLFSLLQEGIWRDIWPVMKANHSCLELALDRLT